MENDKELPSFSEYDPFQLPWTKRAIIEIFKEFDYSKGIHEILCSGTVGCIKEDTLVSTICGEVPIADITSQDFLLSFSHSQNQFVFQQGSDAFPKGKDYLYRVIHEHGEFEATENHLLSSSEYTYLPVSSFSSGDELISFSQDQEKTNLSTYQISLLLNVLNSRKTILSLIYDCVEHIRLCDPQLHTLAKTYLDAFPFQDDVREFSQFSYFHKHEHLDDFLGLELIHSHPFELCAPRSMKDFLNLLESKPLGGVCLDKPSKRLLSSSLSIRKDLKPHGLNEIHPHIALQFLHAVHVSLKKLLIYNRRCHPIKSKVLSIEKKKQDWYWDLQVPNTNNYYANGAIHHNSGKSLFGAHVAMVCLVEDPKARWILGRITRPDAIATIADTFHDHLEGDFVEGKDFEFNIVKQKWLFNWGAELSVKTWHNKKWKSFRSLKISGALIEEATENEGEYWDAYNAIYERLGRAKADKNLMITLTNPDSPAHPLYKKMIIGSENDPLKHVYYSDARDNPFLEDWYIPNLMKNLSPIEIARQIEGKWVEDPKGGIYYNYKRERNYRDDVYVFNLDYPIDIMHDFNIGVGKPMSSAIGQRINDTFHIAKTFLIDGANTEDILQEMHNDGAFNRNTLYRVFGDASGKNRDTRSKTNDYEIIEMFLRRNKINYEMNIPRSNPPVRRRHNRINAKCCNYEQKVQLYIYRDAEPADEGFRLTKLKKGGQYIEDDSLKQQHVTTAIGYWIDYLMEYESHNNAEILIY